MDILLQSDGQLYPPRPMERKSEKPKEPPKKEPPPPLPVPAEPPCPPAAPVLPWEELLIAAIAFIILKSDDQPDIPLLLALAYVLFDSKFSLKGLL